MVEKHPILDAITHIILILGVVLVVLPIYVAFVASTHTTSALFHAPMPLLPGHQFLHNYGAVIVGAKETGSQPVILLMWNSLLMALAIAIGKILLAIVSAYAIVFFNFRFKMLCFWMIFLTLMLPVQVRIIPTYNVVVDLHMLNSFSGLTLPLIASATATFMFRQFFLTIPRELVEASSMDGAGPIRFFFNILLPLSKTNIAALFIIMFIYGWNQYLWPLIATGNDPSLHTVVMSLQQLASVTDRIPPWNYIMATVIMATLLPVLIVILMQRWFVKGLVDTEK